MNSVGVLAGVVDGLVQQEFEHGWAGSPLQQGQVQREMPTGIALADDFGSTAGRLEEPLDDGVRGATPLRKNARRTPVEETPTDSK